MYIYIYYVIDIKVIYCIDVYKKMLLYFKHSLYLQGHYRYCDALFFLGEVKRAIDANHSARDLCKGDQEGMKDLEQQHVKFITETAEPKGIFTALI